MKRTTENDLLHAAVMLGRALIPKKRKAGVDVCAQNIAITYLGCTGLLEPERATLRGLLQLADSPIPVIAAQLQAFADNPSIPTTLQKAATCYATMFKAEPAHAAAVTTSLSRQLWVLYGECSSPVRSERVAALVEEVRRLADDLHRAAASMRAERANAITLNEARRSGMGLSVISPDAGRSRDRSVVVIDPKQPRKINGRGAR